MTILELREKRAKAWEAAKSFLDSHRNDKGMLSAEDDATYTRMENEITDLGKEIARLTKTEADILKLFDAHRGELVVQDDIITDLRGNGFACEDTMFYVHICNLRRKLGSAGSMVVNKRGVGYGLAE